MGSNPSGELLCEEGEAHVLGAKVLRLTRQPPLSKRASASKQRMLVLFVRVSDISVGRRSRCSLEAALAPCGGVADDGGMTTRTPARLFLVTLTLVAAGCGNMLNPSATLVGNTPRVEAPSEAPDIRGTLMRMESGARGGTLVLEEDPSSQANGAKASIQLTSGTAMVGADGYRLNFSDLKVGQTLEAWYEGPVARSYPVQATARAVRLLP